MRCSENTGAAKLFSPERWNEFWARAKASGKPNDVFGLISIAYTSSRRAYHNEEHIVRCLRELDSAKEIAENPNAVEMAVWCHDVIYIVGQKDNEAKSSYWAYDIATLHMGLSPDFGAYVKRLIMATAPESVPDCADSGLMHDIDWSVLGSAPKEYDAYERGIMREFIAIMPEKEYLKGRIGFLEKVLGPGNIFHTPQFREKYDSRARQNVRRALRQHSMKKH